MKMQLPQMKTLIAFLLCATITHTCFCKNTHTELNNFALQLKFEENIVLKDARLLGADGSEIIIDKGSQSFSGELNLYGVFTLSVTYQRKNGLSDEDFSMPLFLQPGATILRFKKIPYGFIISGASRDSYNAYRLLMAKDQQALKSVQKSKSQLNAAVQKGSEDLILTFQKEILRKEDERKNIYIDFIKNNYTSIVGLFAVESYANIVIEEPLEMEKAINFLSDSLQKTENIIALQKKLDGYKKIMVGKTAPEIIQADTSGKSIALADLKGKYVLIDFWASWCKPCRAQNPFLVGLYNKYKDKDFTILSVSLDSYKSAWIKAINDDRLEWLQVSDLKGWKNEAAVTYHIASVPQNYLLNKDGIIIAKNLSEKDLQKKLFQIMPQQH